MFSVSTVIYIWGLGWKSTFAFFCSIWRSILLFCLRIFSSFSFCLRSNSSFSFFSFFSKSYLFFSAFANFSARPLSSLTCEGVSTLAISTYFESGLRDISGVSLFWVVNVLALFSAVFLAVLGPTLELLSKTLSRKPFLVAWPESATFTSSKVASPTTIISDFWGATG